MSHKIYIGGIGSGKSVVSSVLRTMGYPVYDCDSNAKRLMIQNQDVIDAIIEEFGDESYIEGRLNSSYIGSVVFSDKEALKRLNAIVHPAVAKDVEKLAQFEQRMWVESAIPRSSGLCEIASEVWHVTAPEHIRISRVMLRNNCSEQDVRNRIASQQKEEGLAEGEFEIVNDGISAVLPQIMRLL